MIKSLKNNNNLKKKLDIYIQINLKKDNNFKPKEKLWKKRERKLKLKNEKDSKKVENVN